jgi:hypothetical protein
MSEKPISLSSRTTCSTVAWRTAGAIARKAIDRKTGARGLRSIMEPRADRLGRQALRMPLEAEHRGSVHHMAPPTFQGSATGLSATDA